MAIFDSSAALVIAVLIIVSNVFSALLSGKLSLIISFISIALHVALCPVMLLSGAPFSELALVFLISFFTFLLTVYIVKARGGGKDDV